MDHLIHIEIPMLLTSMGTIALLLLTTLPPSLSQPPPSNYFSLCRQPYKCGELALYYPFWDQNQNPTCGGGDQYRLFCEPDPYDYASIQMGSQKFIVQHINTLAYTMTLRPLPPGLDVPETDVCSQGFNFSLNPVFMYNQTVHNITIFSDCPPDVAVDGHYFTNCSSHAFYYKGVEGEVLRQHERLRECKRIIQAPAEAVTRRTDGDEDAALHFGYGFQVNYTLSQQCMRCLRSKGACGSNDKRQFTCYCPDGSNALRCDQSVAGAVIAAVLTICCFICKLSRWQEKSWLPTKSNQDIETFLKNHGDLTLKRYKFSDVKKMANSFKVKLGQGGFGTVYKGELLNGSNVAVKILNLSKRNGDEFINEVASISRTSHVNIVTLLGFCIEGHKKVLIYEFMSNGSLDKFIYKERHENAPSLSWDNLYQIAIGIARGLEYLHKGCNTRILHFDIKPHNILLDENFCPKISDFGLAKLCPRKESIISMSDARGTIGYIAPEVWNRNLGGVSHKSDVYSYGMLLLEIVGGRKNINVEASHTSEIYFPDWIYNKLEQGTHLGLDGEVAVEEIEVVRRMTMVGLWCTQTIPNDRPMMSRVVEMLEGSINSLEMPPKPALFSPVRSEAESSTTVN